MNTNNNIEVDVLHEVFQGLDSDACQHYYEKGRDYCILNEIHQESVTVIGCTTPFSRNKSAICLDPEKGSKA